MVYGTQKKHVLETDELGGYIKAIDNVAGNKWSSADFDSLVLVLSRRQPRHRVRWGDRISIELNSIQGYKHCPMSAG